MAVEAEVRAETDNVLEIRNARVTFEMARGQARVLNDIDLDIERGETLGIIGESGCGKSTFGSYLMNAVEEPGMASGQLLYYPEKDSEPINILNLTKWQLRRVRWEEIAIVSQDAMNAFNPTISVRRHFIDTFDAHNVDKVEGLERAREVLRDLRLEPDRIMDAYKHELSGGEKQRALLAMALIFDPEVVILDEPTAGLDLLVQREILSLLYDIKDDYGFTLLFISHDIPMVAGFADRIAVFYAFNIIELGDTRDVLLNPQHPYTRLLTLAHIELDEPMDQVSAVEGDTPDPINVPSGCPFHPRCPIADDRCVVEEVELRGDEGDHQVACFYPDIAVDRVPIHSSLIEDGDST